MHFGYNPQLGRQLDKAFDQLVEQAIRKFKGNRIASNANNVLFAKPIVVAEWMFLQLVNIGSLNIQHYERCQVKFSNANHSMVVYSDHDEIKTDFSRTIGLGITEFDIPIEQEVLNFIQQEDQFSLSILIPSYETKGLFSSKRVVTSIDYEINDVEKVKEMMRG